MKLPDLNNISSTGLFDRGSVRAYGLACALAALEEALKLCEQNTTRWPAGLISHMHKRYAAHECANGIRALRTELENTE